MNLTEHFTLDELTISQEAARFELDNSPGEPQIDALRTLCVKVLEPLRAHVKWPIIVSSGYRAKNVNARIGGAPSSQHCKGEAVDFIIPGMSTANVVALIRALDLPFDQVIDEFSRWVHVSHSEDGQQRGEVLLALHRDGAVRYRKVV